jgi:transcriptional regulator with XRE-family HTH domain
MFNKNLKYYRLKNNLSMKELASRIGVSQMAISHYESGDRRPDMDTMKALAAALGVRVTDFLSNRNENLVFVHGEFRKESRLPARQQEFIRESAEEYMNRFFSVVDVLGGEVLPEAPKCHGLALTDNVEADAGSMRKYLKISESGPVGNLIELLENKGILVYVCDIENDAFSGMNGQVNGRPYIIVNGNMTTERIRSTIAHEMAHFIFVWPENLEEKEIEDRATAISGAFLFPSADAVRELGIRRTSITKDMTLTCKEYGISMCLLVKRAAFCGIVSENVARDFYIKAAKAGWKKHEPSRIGKEEPIYFMQLVFRAVSEREISVQKGAELLKMPYTFVAEHCFAQEA